LGSTYRAKRRGRRRGKKEVAADSLHPPVGELGHIKRRRRPWCAAERSEDGGGRRVHGELTGEMDKIHQSRIGCWVDRAPGRKLVVGPKLEPSF
jgi:hypothetical protein